MANRVKEDEKNERIIRGLLKLPDNRRCINCNSLVRFVSFLVRPFFSCINLFARVTNLTKPFILSLWTDDKCHAIVPNFFNLPCKL